MSNYLWQFLPGRGSKRARRLRQRPRRVDGFRPRLQVLEDRLLLAASFVPNEVLIQFKPGVANDAVAEVRSLISGVLKERIQTGPMLGEGSGILELVSLPASIAVDRAIDRLKVLPTVGFAEPNWIYTHQATSNDPYYTDGSLWGMYGDDLPSPVGPSGTTNQYGSQAEEAWAAGYTGSNAVYVGVIDEGIQSHHPDLIANRWNNPFDPSDGVDNDGNDYVDDMHGWDFYSNDNSIYDGTGDDHGTHVTGTIAAKGGNAAGVAGVNWNVTYISAKFLGPFGGTTLDAIEAVNYFTKLKTRAQNPINIVALNNSWGGGGYSQGLHEAIIRAAKADILFVASAGNSSANNNTTASYPANYDTTQGTPIVTAASYDSVIAVAATTRSGSLASFSNYGSTTVDLGAPGSAILSTVPTATGSGYASYSGTSMAAPHVTGAAALYAAMNPGATALQIKNAILDAARATPTASLQGKTLTGGRLNVSALVPSTPSVSIDDVAQLEGNNPLDTTRFQFRVSLSRPSSADVTVTYATRDGGATTADSDYQPVTDPPDTVIPAGETQATITVFANGDLFPEPDETFFVDLTNVTNATIGDGEGVGTIRNDDGAPPSLSISDVTLSENADEASFTVTLSALPLRTVRVDYATANGTATAGSDYMLSNGTLTFGPNDPVDPADGTVKKTIPVPIANDVLDEADETFFVNLSDATNANIANGQGQGTIQDDDPGPSLSISDATPVTEGNTGTVNANFTVTLDAVSGRDVSVNFATADGTPPNAATAGADYVAKSGVLTIPAGSTSGTITVAVKGDTTDEPNETFMVNLTNPTYVTITDGQGEGTITDDDEPTKFYVVNDPSTGAGSTYEYTAAGVAVKNYVLASGNTNPRGAASTAAGDKVWVVDTNRNVYVYNTSGAPPVSWSAGGMASGTPEGIATNGTDVWILLNRSGSSDRVYKYAGAAAPGTSGTRTPAAIGSGSFNLTSGNTNAKDIVTDGTSLWVVNDASTNSVYKYAIGGSLQGSWTIDAANTTPNTTPSGITIDPAIDPANMRDIWIVDSGTDRVYRYVNNAAGRTSGSQLASASFVLSFGNTNPQGIADPPSALVAEPSPASALVTGPPAVIPTPYLPLDGSLYGLGDFDIDGIHPGAAPPLKPVGVSAAPTPASQTSAGASAWQTVNARAVDAFFALRRQATQRESEFSLAEEWADWLATDLGQIGPGQV